MNPTFTVNKEIENSVLPDLKLKPILEQEIQYIDKDEKIALERNGYIIPENVVYIPISKSTDPIRFNIALKLAVEHPELTMDIIMNNALLSNPNSVIINVSALAKEFEGESGVKIISDIQAGIPLSKKTTEILIGNKIITSEKSIVIPELTKAFNEPDKDWDELIIESGAETPEQLKALKEKYPLEYAKMIEQTTKPIYSEINPEVIEIPKIKGGAVPSLELSENELGESIIISTDPYTKVKTEVTPEQAAESQKTIEQKMDVYKVPMRELAILQREEQRVANLGILDKMTEWIYRIIYNK